MIARPAPPTALPARLADAAARHARLVLLLALIATAAAGLFAARRFAMTTDTTALIAPTTAWRVNERRLDAAFPARGDTLLAVVDGPTPELAEAAAARLAAAMAADPRFRRVTRPDGGAFFARAGLLYRSEAEVAAATRDMIAAQPFLGPLAADPSLRGIATLVDTMMRGVDRSDVAVATVRAPIARLAAALDAQASGRPAAFSWQSLLGGEGAGAPRRRLVLATPVLDYGALLPGEAASDRVRALARQLRADPAHGVRVRLTGSVPLADEEFGSLAEGAGVIGLVMLACMVGTLRLATRSWRVAAAILATTIAGLVLTAALGLATVGRFNLISVAFIPLFVGLGIDFGIQIGVRFQAERRHEADVARALGTAAGALGRPLVLAAAAVCLGFLAFLPTAYVGIAELGVIAGLGMIVALLLSLTLLPALLVLVRPRAVAADIGNPALAPLDRLLLLRRRQVLLLFGIALVGGVASLAFVRFDFNPLHLRDPKGEAMATLADLARDPDRDPNTIELLAPDLPAAQRLAARLASLPEVGMAVTAASFVPDDQAPKLAQIGDAAALLGFTLDPLEPAAPPTDAETVAALRQAAAHLRTAAPAEPAAARLDAAFARLAAAGPDARRAATAMLVPPLDTMLGQLRDALAAAPVTLATLPPDIRADWIGRGGQARIELHPAGRDRSDAALARFVAAVTRVAPDATGVAVSTQAAARTVAGAFVEAGVLAFVAIALLLFAALRDVREVLFTLAPVVLSGFLTLGTCVLIGQPINFANIIAFPLLFGVGVAFHIYFVVAWRDGATELLQSPLARAVFFSALATGSAFGSLWLSSHPGTASMGKILMISLAWTLVCALIFEPALLGPPRSRDGDRSRGRSPRGAA